MGRPLGDPAHAVHGQEGGRATPSRVDRVLSSVLVMADVETVEGAVAAPGPREPVRRFCLSIKATGWRTRPSANEHL